MASSYARLMICTMDPMLDSKMHENGNLLELDGHRAVEKRRLERASSLPSLTPLPRDWVKALPPDPIAASPVADARSANAPAPAADIAAAPAPASAKPSRWGGSSVLQSTFAANRDRSAGLPPGKELLKWWQSDAGRGKFGFKGLALRSEHRKLLEQSKEASAPKLRSEAPHWWRVPEPVLDAADSFDGRHVTRVTRAERMRNAALEEADNQRKQQRLRREIFEVFSNRYVEPYKRVEVVVLRKSTVKKVEKKVAEKPFILENTIWAPRKTWCDAKSFYDTPEVRAKRFQLDWQSAVESLDLSKVPFCPDADGKGTVDEDGDGLPEEVEEVGAVLLTAANLIFNVFHYYAALGDDLFGIAFNEWTQFVNDHKLASKRFKFCKKSDLDRLFIVIDSASSRYWEQVKKKLKADARPDSALQARANREDKRKSLTRVEFTAALVHIAIYQHVQSGDIDVSEAVDRLLNKDLGARIDQRIIIDPNVFRRSTCYTREITDVLEAHETSLRLLFAGVAGGGRTGLAASLLGLEEWSDFLNAIGFIGSDLSDRDARFAFVWSRMCVIDGRFHRATSGNAICL